MKKILLFIFITFSTYSTSAFFGDVLDFKKLLRSDKRVTITSLTNTKNSGAMEVCGIVKDQEQGRTNMVTIKHLDSSYTTLTDEEGMWCQIIKRWTYTGKIDVYSLKSRSF